MKPLEFLKALSLSVTVAVVGSAASASVTLPTCDILNFTTSTDCISPVTGGSGDNVTADAMNDFGPDGAFGHTGWTLLDYLDNPENADVGDTQNSKDGLFSITYMAPLYKQGTWALNPLFNWGAGKYAFAIKGATDNAVYLMDLAFRDGNWFVNDLLNAGGNNPDMSNVRLFGTEPLAPIPLPAAGWLLLAGLGGLAAARRMKKAA